MNNRELGKKGEKIAEDYLVKKAYKILAKNYQKRTGEIDIIVENPQRDQIIFVEVKTRNNDNFGKPEEAVNQKKIEKIEKTALMWLDENKKTNTLWRIDIITIELQKSQKITHFKNVTI